MIRKERIYSAYDGEQPAASRVVHQMLAICCCPRVRAPLTWKGGISPDQEVHPRDPAVQGKEVRFFFRRPVFGMSGVWKQGGI